MGISFLKSKKAKENIALNIFTQEIEPGIKEGIWLKSDNKIIEHTVLDQKILVNGEWDTVNIYPTIPYSFSNICSTHVGDYIYFFSISSAYKYNLSTHEFTQLNISIDISSAFECTSIDTNIYVIRSKNLYKYDTITGEYSSLKSIPSISDSVRAVAYGSDIYMFSGTNAYKYDTLTDTYIELTKYPSSQGFYNSSIALVGTDIYLFGSHSQSSWNSDVYKYNIKTNEYSRISYMPEIEYDCGCVVTGTDVYLLGSGFSNYAKYVYKYDTLTNEFTRLPDIPYDFNGRGAVIVGTVIYLFGGSQYPEKIQAFILQSKQYENNTLVIAQDTDKYKTQIISLPNIEGRLTNGFDNFYFYEMALNGFDKNIEKYYGNGSEWVRINS